MLPKYQIIIFAIYNDFIGNVKKLVPTSFDKEKYVLFYKNYNFTKD